MHRIGLDAVPHDRTACIQLTFQSTLFAADLTDYEGSPSVAGSWKSTWRMMWHSISVVVHGVSSGGPAVILLVLEPFISINTEVFLCQHMRHILGCYTRFNVHLSRKE